MAEDHQGSLDPIQPNKIKIVLDIREHRMQERRLLHPDEEFVQNPYAGAKQLIRTPEPASNIYGERSDMLHFDRVQHDDEIEMQFDGSIVRRQHGESIPDLALSGGRSHLAFAQSDQGILIRLRHFQIQESSIIRPAK